jgi:hypothetical protein
MSDATWIETEATVTTCRYQFRALSPLAFGFQTGEKFRITFDYYAHGQLYSDEFQSPVAIAQNERVAVSYNPLHPEQNNLSRNEPASERRPPPLIAIGITGSIILSLIWLAILRGCH